MDQMADLVHLLRSGIQDGLVDPHACVSLAQYFPTAVSLRFALAARDGLVVVTSNLLEPGTLCISLVPSLIALQGPPADVTCCEQAVRHTELVCCNVPLAAAESGILLLQLPHAPRPAMDLRTKLDAVASALAGQIEEATTELVRTALLLMPECSASTCPLLQPAQLPGSSSPAFEGSCSHSIWPDAAHVHSRRSRQAPCRTANEGGSREDTMQGPAVMAGGAAQEALPDQASCSNALAAGVGPPSFTPGSNRPQQGLSEDCAHAEPSKASTKPPLYPRKGAAGGKLSAASGTPNQVDTAQHWLLLSFRDWGLEQRYTRWSTETLLVKVDVMSCCLQASMQVVALRMKVDDAALRWFLTARWTTLLCALHSAVPILCVYLQPAWYCLHRERLLITVSVLFNAALLAGGATYQMACLSTPETLASTGMMLRWGLMETNFQKVLFPMRMQPALWRAAVLWLITVAATRWLLTIPAVHVLWAGQLPYLAALHLGFLAAALVINWFIEAKLRRSFLASLPARAVS